MNASQKVARSAALAAAAALALTCGGCSVSAGSLDRAGGEKTIAPTNLVMAAPAGTAEIGAYVDAVSRLSGGSLQVQVLSRAETDAQVGLTAADVVDAVRRGAVPLALLPARDFGALGIHSLDALQAPFVIDSLGLEAELLRDQDLTTPMLDEIGHLGVEGVGILPGPLVHPFGITHPLLAPADFDGARIAVGTGEVAAQTLTRLGATPVVSEFNGASLENTDGALLQLPSITGNSYHAPGRSVTADVTLWPRPLVVIANVKAVAALNDKQRGALHDAVASGIDGIVRTDEAMDVEAEGIGCGGGLSLPSAGRADLNALREIVRPVVAAIGATEVGAAVFARVDQLQGSISSAKPLVCIAKPDSWPTEASSRLDGTYTSDTTADDLRAQGIPEQDLVPENWGHWTLVVKGGRFAVTQEDESACTWAYGVWRMNDDLVRTTLEGGGGIAPYAAVSQPGEDFVYHWTDFGGTLKLTLAMHDGPYNMAYTRVSDVPKVTAFPARCTPPPAAFATK